MICLQTSKGYRRKQDLKQMTRLLRELKRRDKSFYKEGTEIIFTQVESDWNKLQSSLEHLHLKSYAVE